MSNDLKVLQRGIPIQDNGNIAEFDKDNINNILNYDKSLNINKEKYFIDSNNGIFRVFKNMFPSISCGDYYTFILKNDGTVFSTGYNNYGQLGLGDTTNKNTFTKVNIDNVKSISCGYSHTFILKNDGTVFSTGYNSSGQLGTMNNDNLSSFLHVGYLDNIFENEKDNLLTEYEIQFKNGINKIVYTKYNTLILDNNGSLWANGNNSEKQTLGIGNDDLKRFKKISINVKDFDSGENGFTIMIKNNGSLLSTGTGSDGAAGKTDNLNMFSEIKGIPNPIKVSCGNSHTAIIDENKDLWVAGNGKVVGFTNTSNLNKFTKVLSVSLVKDVKCASDMILVLLENGNVYASGVPQGSNTVIGPHSTGTSYKLIDSNAVKIFNTKGGNASYILKSDGTLKGCGTGYMGDYSNASNTQSQQLNTIEMTDVKSIVGGSNHTLLLKNDGTLWGLGQNDKGQLAGVSGNEFKQITNIPLVKEIFAANKRSAILTNDGRVFMTGEDVLNDTLKCNLGVGTGKNDVDHFMELPSYTIKEILLHENFALINRKRLKIVNDKLDYTTILGQDYLSKYTLEHTIPLPERFNIKQFWLSTSGSVLLNSDNKVYVCGDLGFGNKVDFTDVSATISDVKSVSCGKKFSMFITNSGTVKAIGENVDYQFGRGDNINTYEIVTIPNITNAKKIFCGERFTYILKEDGKLLVAGYNENGMLGAGKATSNTHIKTFTEVATNVRDVEIGKGYVQITHNDNSVSISGKNDPSLKLSSTDTTQFNKISIPSELLPHVRSVDAGTPGLLCIGYRLVITKAYLSLENKKASSVTVNITDPLKEITKLELFINSNLVHTVQPVSSEVLHLNIPLDKLTQSDNLIEIKASTTTNETIIEKYNIIKSSGSGMSITEGMTLVIGGNPYKVVSITPDLETRKSTVTLDKPLATAVAKGDLIVALKNKLGCEFNLNNKGTFSKATMTGFKFNNDGTYREIYELESLSENITSASAKVTLQDGDATTGIKRPSMLFRYSTK